MVVNIKVSLERADGVALTSDQRERVIEQLEQGVGEIAIEEIVKYEGTAREETIGVEISVDEVIEEEKPKKVKAAK